MNDEKSLYSSQNYVMKAISILSNMTNLILKASVADNCLLRPCELSKIVPERNNPLESYFSRVHKKKKKQLKKNSLFRFSSPLWTKTRYHSCQS